MDANEAQALVNAGAAIDMGEAAANEAAVAGLIDSNGAMIPQAAPNPDAAAMEWLIIPQTMAWAIKMIFPEAAANYTEEAEMDLARRIVPVAEKYGWNGPGDAPELALAFGAIGFSMPAILAYKARKAAAKANVENAQTAGDKQAGGADGSHE